MVYDNHKQHKVVHKLDERITAVESIVMIVAKLGSIFLFIAGFAGFVLTASIDKIRGRLFEFDWFQISGLAIFLIMAITGVYMLWLIRKRQ